jgi:FAD:protein FMN transferase
VTARAEWRALGTSAVVLVADGSALGAARAAVAAELDAIDRACSRFRDDSELTRVNAARGRSVAISPLLAQAIGAALRAARVTDGAVDPTIGRALVLAGYDRDLALVEDSPAPLRAVRAPGLQAVRLDPGAGVVRVAPGVTLDLGATAKALAADRAAAAAATAAGCGVLVNLGGDLATAGRAPHGGWLVRVTDDHAAPADAPGETVAIGSGALATSSVTVRRWRRGGAAVHHILDPATGAPATGPWRTVSVAAESCVDANTASTAALVRGRSAADWLESLALPARLCAHDGRVLHTAGWAGAERAGAAA